jgi:hypothetical protein
MKLGGSLAYVFQLKERTRRRAAGALAMLVDRCEDQGQVFPFQNLGQEEVESEGKASLDVEPNVLYLFALL